MDEEFEFVTDYRVRFRDVDAMGHVNNAVYATYLEQTRAEFFREVLDESLAAVDTVLASLSIQFDRPIEPDDKITVGLTIEPLGESSIPMAYEIQRGDGSVAATAESVQVVFDSASGKSRPIPDAWRSKIESSRAP